MNVSVKRKEEMKKYYHDTYKLGIRKNTTILQYRCPLCSWYWHDINRFEAKSLDVMQKTNAGKSNVLIDHAPITEEYKQRIIRVCKEIIKELDK